MEKNFGNKHVREEISAFFSPVAYGDFEVPIIHRNIKKGAKLEKLISLKQMRSCLTSSEKSYQAISSGCVTTLHQCLRDDEPSIRYETLKILVIIATHSAGRRAMMELDAIIDLRQLLQDEVEDIRFEALRCLSRLSMNPEGTNHILKHAILPQLLQRLEEETNKIRIEMFTIMQSCVRCDPESSIRYKIVEKLEVLLNVDDDTVQEKTVHILADICTSLKGKEAVLQNGIILNKLVELLEETSSICVEALTCLMFISITTEGKKTLNSKRVLPTLIKLLDSEFSEIKLYAMKLITCLSEDPFGRAYLQKHGFAADWGDLTYKQNNGVNIQLQRAKYIAQKVIYKKP